MASVTVTSGQTRTTRVDLAGSEFLTVEAGGTVSVSASNEAVLVAAAAQDVTITNGGMIKVTTAVPQYAISAGLGSVVSVTNSTDAEILGMDSAIFSQGSLTLTNHGLIEGDLSAIDVDGEVTIENFGIIRGTDTDTSLTDGIRMGGGTVTNSGHIYGYWQGIDADASSAEVRIFNTGTIEAAFGGEGIHITGTMPDTVVNNGYIVGGIDRHPRVAISLGDGDSRLFIGANSGIEGVTYGGGGTNSLDYLYFGSGGVTATIEQAQISTGTSRLYDFHNIFGSSGIDIFTGSTGNNILYGRAGNDVLIGGLGADTLIGDSGLDTASYVKSRTGLVVSLSAPGTNTGEAADDTFSSIEGLVGTHFADTLTGNSVANRIDGGRGNDVLIGGAGADRLTGGDGSDTYTADILGDVIIEVNSTSAGGDDRVAFMGTAGTFVLGANIERLTLQGTSAINGTGNTLANTISGNAAGNVLTGRGGKDILAGGAGVDYFVLDTTPSSANIDTFSDMTTADFIRLSKTVFMAIGPAFTSNEFRANTTGLAGDADDRIIYETDTGRLFYDINGSAAGGAVQIAALTTRPAITVADFQFV